MNVFLIINLLGFYFHDEIFTAGCPPKTEIVSRNYAWEQRNIIPLIHLMTDCCYKL